MTVEEKITYNNCQGNGCHEHCIIKVYSKDGNVTRTERAVLKGSKADKYSICAKGLVAGKLLDMPDRVLYPLKRVGKRGEGKFERISWDQALEEISTKLGEITAKYGPRSLVFNTFLCGIPLNIQGSLSCSLALRFIHTTDCSQLDMSPIDMSSFQSNFADFGAKFFPQFGNLLHWDRHRPNYFLIWGGTPIGWSRPARDTQMLMDAQEQGTKIVTVGLLYDSNAAKSDEFVNIRAGTDAAMALAMCNVLISEGLYDSKFLTTYTVAPFLVRLDNGKLLRKREVITDVGAASAKADSQGENVDFSYNPLFALDGTSDSGEEYVAWDVKTVEPIFIAAGVNDWGDATPDLLADVEVNGIRCKTAFVLMKEHVAKWTPETQEEVTGVSADTVLHLVHDFMDHLPSAVYTYWGLRYRNGGQSLRAINLFAYLSGCVGMKNGRLMSGATGEGYPLFLDWLIQVPDGDLAALKGESIMVGDIVESIGDATKQQYKAYFNAYSNPVLNWPSRQMWTEQIFPNMELIVVCEIRHTDTSDWADYVLPDSSILEREEIASAADCLVYNEPVAPPKGECKDSAEIWRFLAKCAGVEEKFAYSTEDWLRLKLETQTPELTGIQPPVTLERLREEKIIPLNVPDEVDDIWEQMTFASPTGRIEFYNEAFAHLSLAMADYVPTRVNDREARKKYPLQFYPGRSRFFMQGQFTDIPELREIAGFKSVAAINPTLAQERGICEGDLIEVFNDQGCCQAYAHLSQWVPPDLVHFWYPYPAKDYITNPPTVLTSAIGLDDTYSEFGSTCMDLEMERTANVPYTLTLTFTRHIDCFWDDLVDIRKG